MRRFAAALCGAAFLLLQTAFQAQACSCASTPSFFDLIRNLKQTGDRPFAVVLATLLPPGPVMGTSQVRVIRHYDSFEPRDTLTAFYMTECDRVLHSSYKAGDTLLLVLQGFNDSSGRYVLTACGCSAVQLVNYTSTNACTATPPGTPLAAFEDSIRRFSLQLPFCGTDLPQIPVYTLAPNPATGTTTLYRSSPVAEAVSISIYTTTGIPVSCYLQIGQGPVGTAWTLDIAHLPAGQYWVHIQESIANQTVPLVVGPRVDR